MREYRVISVEGMEDEKSLTDKLNNDVKGGWKTLSIQLLNPEFYKNFPPTIILQYKDD